MRAKMSLAYRCEMSQIQVDSRSSTSRVELPIVTLLDNAPLKVQATPKPKSQSSLQAKFTFWSLEPANSSTGRAAQVRYPAHLGDVFQYSTHGLSDGTSGDPVASETTKTGGGPALETDPLGFCGLGPRGAPSRVRPEASTGAARTPGP